MTANRRLLAVIVLIVAVVALVAVFITTRGSQDYPGPGSGSTTVIVVRGDSLSAIGNTLVEAGVVASTQAFIDAADANPRSRSIGPGSYTMLREMSGADAVALMIDPASRAASRLVLPEGLRLPQSIDTASKATGIPVPQFTDALTRATSLGLPAYANGNSEGFLFPASYDLAGDETAESTLRMLYARFATASRQLNLKARAAQVGRTPYEIMIIASLVQAEGNPTDYRKIARVIYNRLESGMRLEFDTSIAYGLGITRVSLTADQLRTDTPYNTRLHGGLPPTPINSPGEAAINAALDPAAGSWLYFVTVNLETGETKFARSYAKFLEYKAQLQAYLRNQG